MGKSARKLSRMDAAGGAGGAAWLLSGAAAVSPVGTMPQFAERLVRRPLPLPLPLSWLEPLPCEPRVMPMTILSRESGAPVSKRMVHPAMSTCSMRATVASARDLPSDSK